MLQVALSPRGESLVGKIWPESPTLENFGTVLGGDPSSPLPDFWAQFGNSLIAASVTTIVVIVVATSTAFAITRLRPAWGTPIGTSALLIYVIPASFLSIPLFILMLNLGLTGKLVAVILGTITLATPYAIWVLREFGRDIPIELDESATMDGAGSFGIFRYVFLPMIRPALVPVAVYAFLLSWNDFLLAFLLLTDPTSLTLPVGLQSILHENAPWTIIMSAGIIYAIPPLLVYTIFRRQLVGDLTAGAVKG